MVGRRSGRRVPHPGGRRVAHAFISEAFAQFRQRQRALLQERVVDRGAQTGCSQQAAIETDLALVVRGVPEKTKQESGSRPPVHVDGGSMTWQSAETRYDITAP
jgi:hypothetical protein